MYSIYYGDLHNHNALGYGKGSLERSIDIAKEHLDFFAFTGHSSWHDLVPMEGGRERHWIQGFERLRAGWDQVVRLTNEANEDPDFVSFLGFEWHSSAFGDQCVLFPGNEGHLVYPNHVDDLRRFCIENKALMIPHHLAYPKGHRGVNWDVFDPACTPFVEIFSEHGSSEDDRGAFAFFNHAMGGRITSQTTRAALSRGLKFGFSGSTDNHRGFPGAFGEGLMGVLATDLSRHAIMDALRKRRLYALTGDRIEVNFSVEGRPMGSDVSKTGSAHVAFDVKGRDELDVVEIIQDGIVVHRAYPDPVDYVEGPCQFRVEWGWGPWLDLDLDRVADWDFEINLEGGRIGRIFPCLQSGPFDESRRHRIRRARDKRVHVQSYSARRGGYRGNPNQSVVIEIEGSSPTQISLAGKSPRRFEARFSIDEMNESGRMVFTGDYPAEAVLIHRPVSASASEISGTFELSVPDHASQVYMKVRQKNGQTAWCSPAFLNY